MAKFLLRRLLNTFILVFIATSLAYLLAASTLDPRSNYEGRQTRPPAAVIDAKLDQANLNDKTPLLTRYWTWVKGVFSGDLGETWENDSVNAEVGRRMGVSLRLLTIGTILGTLLGIAAGALGAIRQYKPSDHVVTITSFVLLSMPVFVLAVLLEILAIRFNHATGSQFFQYTGEYTPGLGGGFFDHLGDRLQHLILPTLTLILLEAALVSRYQRNAMLDVLSSDYVRTAQAKGLRRRTALTKHALRTALIPSVTLFAYSFGTVLVGAVFTEKIFGWHGMGEWLVDSITRNDVNAVGAISCFTAVLVLIAGLMSDVMYALLDPRIRVS